MIAAGSKISRVPSWSRSLNAPSSRPDFFDVRFVTGPPPFSSPFVLLILEPSVPFFLHRLALLVPPVPLYTYIFSSVLFAGTSGG